MWWPATTRDQSLSERPGNWRPAGPGTGSVARHRADEALPSQVALEALGSGFTVTNWSEQMQQRFDPRTTSWSVQRTACGGTGASDATVVAHSHRPHRHRIVSRPGATRSRCRCEADRSGTFKSFVLSPSTVWSTSWSRGPRIGVILFASHQKDLRGDYLRILNSLQSSVGFVSSRNGFFREITTCVAFDDEAVSVRIGVLRLLGDQRDRGGRTVERKAMGGVPHFHPGRPCAAPRDRLARDKISTSRSPRS